MADRRYVAGFLFKRVTPHVTKVLLVRKTHPEWQAGLMNAIGGEIEKGEIPNDAMKREFFEEAQWSTNDWHHFCIEQGPGYFVHFYRSWIGGDGDIGSHYQPPRANDKGEELEWCDANGPKYPVVGNLNWLLPLALDPRPISVSVLTRGDIKVLRTW